MGFDLERAVEAVRGAETLRVEGQVLALRGLALEGTLPGARVGDAVEVRRREGPPLEAEVVGFDREVVRLLPLGRAEGVGPGDRLRALGGPPTLRVGEGLIGRVLDGMGRAIDGGPAVEGEQTPITRDAPPPLERERIRRALPTGVRAIDGLMTLAEGQRVGLFAGSGVGKSTLLAQIARGASADVVVMALVGERGRELREVIDEGLGDEGLRRSVVVCATSDAPAIVRMRAAFVATAIAERFRDDGRKVLLLMDSVTRFARAAREVGLAAGEPPARRGFPPSVFAALPALLERAGTAARGSITGVYSVLVEGGDLDEPIADEVRGLLDGHVVLDRALAARGRWPAIDPLRSLSRVMGAVTDEAHRAAAEELRGHLAVYEDKRDLVLLGAYEPGRDRRLDASLGCIDAVEGFLRQRPDERSHLDATLAGLRAAIARGPSS